MALYRSEPNRYWEFHQRENNLLENLQDIFSNVKGVVEDSEEYTNSDYEYSDMITIENVISDSEGLK